MPIFKVHTPYQPAGDQPVAIEALSSAIKHGERFVALEGVTGSGKTYTMAKVIESVQLPTIIMTHNKHLRRSCIVSLEVSFLKTMLSILFRTTITINQRRTCTWIKLLKPSSNPLYTKFFIPFLI